MIPEPPPIDEVDALHRLLDEWLDSAPGSAERAALAARLAASPQGAMWLAARDSLVGGENMPELATAVAERLTADDRAIALHLPTARRDRLGALWPRFAPLLLGGFALVAALAGVILWPAGSGGELSGSAVPVAPGALPTASAAQPAAAVAQWVLAVALAVAAWWAQRRRP